jgi:hypothetical protein
MLDYVLRIDAMNRKIQVMESGSIHFTTLYGQGLTFTQAIVECARFIAEQLRQAGAL